MLPVAPEANRKWGHEFRREVSENNYFTVPYFYAVPFPQFEGALRTPGWHKDVVILFV